MLYKSRYFRLISLLVLAVIFAAAGCQQSAQKTALPGDDPLTVAKGADLQRTTEVELVERMADYRGKYQQNLALLKIFYERQGNNLKAGWVQQELESLKTIPQRAYLVVAELASAELKATQAIVEADVLYDQAMALFKQGRGKLAFLTNKKKLYLARDKFNQLITAYPQSDKIDDAAFQIGQIDHLYLKDYHSALLHYRRVWQWDPQTPWPCRFAVAKIYDEKLHDLTRAIEYYEKAIKFELDHPKNAVYAKGRIAKISKDLEK